MAQNDPAELQNQLAKMTEKFVKLNKEGQFEIMPGAKRQLREIEQALNIPYETLTKMAIGTKELDMKMQQMDFSKYNFTEEQRTMIANMAEMGDDGQFKISIKGDSLNLDEAMREIAGMGEKEREKFFEATKEKTVEELAKEQLTALEEINANTAALKTFPFAVAGTEKAKQAIEAPRLISRQVANVLTGTEVTKISNLTKGIEDGSSRILNDINKLITGEGSMTQLLTTMGDVGKKFESFFSTGTEQMIVQYEKSIKELSEANNIFIDILLNSGKKLKDMFMINENLNQSQTPPPPLPLPNQSNFEMINMTPPVNNTQQTQSENNKPVDINLKVSVESLPSGINPQDVILALNNESVKEAVVTAVNSTITSNGMLTYMANPQRLRNITNNASGLTGVPR